MGVSSDTSTTKEKRHSLTIERLRNSGLVRKSQEALDGTPTSKVSSPSGTPRGAMCDNNFGRAEHFDIGDADHTMGFYTGDKTLAQPHLDGQQHQAQLKPASRMWSVSTADSLMETDVPSGRGTLPVPTLHDVAALRIQRWYRGAALRRQETAELSADVEVEQQQCRLLAAAECQGTECKDYVESSQAVSGENKRAQPKPRGMSSFGCVAFMSAVVTRPRFRVARKQKLPAVM